MLIERDDDGPSIFDYERAAAIPEAERCEKCSGTGRVVFMNCDPGPNRYARCHACDGSGRKEATKAPASAS